LLQVLLQLLQVQVLQQQQAASARGHPAAQQRQITKHKTTCSRLLLSPQLPLRRGPAGNIVLRGRAAISAVPGLALVGLGARYFNIGIVRWAFHGKGIVRYAATNWIKRYDAFMLSRCTVLSKALQFVWLQPSGLFS